MISLITYYNFQNALVAKYPNYSAHKFLQHTLRIDFHFFASRDATVTIVAESNRIRRVHQILVIHSPAICTTLLNTINKIDKQKITSNFY